MIKETVKLFLEKYKLLKSENNIIVAFSGGYDSMCLLHVMKELSKEYKFNIIAIHLNHCWRGEESDNEEIVCKNFASDIFFYSEKLSTKIPHTETAARDARYKFFEKCAKKFNSNVVLTAHNANDNAETVFYRMMKGTGLTGIEGIQEHRDIYYRPLLTIYRNDIEKYCIKNRLKPNQDSSNSNTKFMRNKIRKVIFPKLKKDFPDIEKSLNNISESAKAVNEIINEHIKPLEAYSIREFTGLDKTLQTAVIHKFYRAENLDYDRKKINDLLDFIIKNVNSKAGKTVSLKDNLWLFVNNKQIKKVTKTTNNVDNIKIEKIGIFKNGEYVFEINKTNTTPKTYPKDTEYKAYIQTEELDFVLRQRKDGDVIQPLGMKGTQKLKKYLNSKKIPKHERDNIPFLCKNNEIMWAPGIGLNDKIKVKTKPTHVLTLKRG